MLKLAGKYENEEPSLCLGAVAERLVYCYRNNVYVRVRKEHDILRNAILYSFSVALPNADAVSVMRGVASVRDDGIPKCRNITFPPVASLGSYQHHGFIPGTNDFGKARVTSVCGEEGAFGICPSNHGV